MLALKRAFYVAGRNFGSLTSESVEGAALALQGVDNIHGGNSFPLGMLSVGDSITDNILKEDFENTSCFFIDQSRDTLDSTSPGQTPDGGLGDTLDVITQNFAMTLGATLSESLSSFTTSSHVDSVSADEYTFCLWWRCMTSAPTYLGDPEQPNPIAG